MFLLLPVPSCPTTIHLQEESGSIFSVSSSHTVIDCNNISPQPSLCEAKPIVFCQPVVLRHVLQPLHQRGGLH